MVQEVTVFALRQAWTSFGAREWPAQAASAEAGGRDGRHPRGEGSRQPRTSHVAGLRVDAQT